MQKVLSFNVHPLPILVEKIKKFFVGKFVVVKYGSCWTYSRFGEVKHEI